MSDTAARFGVMDAPILSDAEDHLGLTSYAEALGKFILACDTPMTVGIQGDWGAGKTSLMNLIASWLSSQSGAPVPAMLTVNTWQYAQLSSDDAISLSILRALHEKVSGPDQGVRKVWGRLAATFGRVKSVQTAVGGFELKDNEALPDLEELKSAFASAVHKHIADKKNGTDRLVVFVDDLDRVLPERAVEILEALKNFVDVEGCIFVLACDYAVVAKGLKKKFDVGQEDLGGRSFFDKIIQVPFRMPVARYKVDTYIRAMLTRIGWTLDGDNIEVYQRLLETSVGFNPRGLKRLCNTLLLLRMVADGTKGRSGSPGDEPHRLALLFGLVCMESAHEELYRKCASASAEDLHASLKAVLDPNGATPSPWWPEEREGSPELSKEAELFWRELASLTDKDRSGSIEAEEIEYFQNMLSLSAVTSVNEDPGAAAASRAPTPEQLLERGGSAESYRPGALVYNGLVPYVGHEGTVGVHTTSGAIVFSEGPQGARKQFIRLSPVRRTGDHAYLSLAVGPFEARNSPEEWAGFVDHGMQHWGATNTGTFVKIPVPNEGRAREVLARLLELEPLASAKPGTSR